MSGNESVNGSGNSETATPNRPRWPMGVDGSSRSWRRWALGVLALPLIYLANVAIFVAVDRWRIHVPGWVIVVYLAGLVAAILAGGSALGRTVWETVGALRERRRRAESDTKIIGAIGPPP